MIKFYLRTKVIMSIYGTTCKALFEGLRITLVITIYSQPKNVKDLVAKAKLLQAHGKEAQAYYFWEQYVIW